MNLIVIINIILSILLIISISINYFLFKKKRKSYNADEYSAVFNALILVINSYRTSVVEKEVEKLRKKYDLKYDSPTKAIEPYNNAYTNLLLESSREIGRLISKELYAKILDYYSDEGIIFLIIELLKKNT